jgi:hypothetical protein
MEIIYGIIGTILGWLLGLLSPSIIKKISDKTERKNLEKIIINDLKELKKRLAPLSYSVYPKYGKLDFETFEWLKINSGIDFSEGLRQLTGTDVDTPKILEHLNTKGLQETTSVYFKKMHLFVTDSHMMNFGLIDNTLIEKVLEIRFHIEAFNEDVDSFREHLKMTFLPGITDANYRIVSQEIENKSLEIAKKSIYIVNKINNIINSTNT